MQNKPNILFIMTDQQRHDAIGYRNPEVITPNLNRLAAESVVFKNGYTANPSCIPARAAIFTGRYPSQCGAPTYMTALPDHEQTFMSLLRDNGYFTAVIGKQHFWKTKVDKGYDYMDIVDEHFPPKVISKKLDEREFGLPQHLTISDKVSSYVSFLADNGFTEGAQLFEKIGATKEVYRWKVDEKYHIDSYIGNRGVEWIRNGRPSEPWFLTLSFPGPHTPFDGIGLPDETLYTESELSLPTTKPEDIFKKPPHFQGLLKRYCEFDANAREVVSKMSDREIRLMKKSYYSNVSLIDRKVGEVVEALKSVGEFDNTMIIFLSDHGDFMGDYGMAQKMQCLSEQLMRIPFFIKPPAAGYEGYMEDSFVSSVEVAATCLTAGGIEIPGNMSQRSLTQFFDKETEPDRWKDIYMEARDIRGIRNEQYKLVYYAEREYGELYDLMNDPEERDNLWSKEELQGIKFELLKKLMDRIIQIGQNVHVMWHPSVPEI